MPCLPGCGFLPTIARASSLVMAGLMVSPFSVTLLGAWLNLSTLMAVSSYRVDKLAGRYLMFLGSFNAGCSAMAIHFETAALPPLHLVLNSVQGSKCNSGMPLS